MFATVQDIRGQTTIGEVSSLSDGQIGTYIERADAYIRRVTKKTYHDETDPHLQSDLRRATVLLVEWLWFNDQPAVKESNMGGIESERIASYSYSKGNQNGTGNAELDSILESLKAFAPRGVDVFSVFGPSRVSAKPYNPHAYVNDVDGE